MHPWTAAQLRAFLDWSAAASPLHAAWHVLAYTGMRRGELLALRWRDISLAEGTISIRRSAGIVRNKGEGVQIREGTTKTNKPRMIDIDPGHRGPAEDVAEGPGRARARAGPRRCAGVQRPGGPAHAPRAPQPHVQDHAGPVPQAARRGRAA
jgi:hypothetical protein